MCKTPDDFTRSSELAAFALAPRVINPVAALMAVTPKSLVNLLRVIIQTFLSSWPLVMLLFHQLVNSGLAVEKRHFTRLSIGGCSRAAEDLVRLILGR
jgi:hypothetical protein